jgi:hypothetical protein
MQHFLCVLKKRISSEAYNVDKYQLLNNLMVIIYV